MLIELLWLLPVILTALSITFWTLRLGIGPTPSSSTVVNTLERHLPDCVPRAIIELGCGWGHLLPSLIRHYPDHDITAFERSPVPFCYSWFRYKGRVSVFNKDFFDIDLSQAGLIVCYLCPGAMNRFSKDIFPHIPPGCWIVSHTFAIPDIPMVHRVQVDDLYKTPIYFYQKNHYSTEQM